MEVKLLPVLFLFALLLPASAEAAIGDATEFPASGSPYEIARGFDGALWFTKGDVNDKSLGRISPDGTVTSYGSLAGNARGITRGLDGNLWFTETSNSSFGKVEPDGTITEYPGLLPASSSPWGVVGGIDGAIWIVLSGAGKLARVDTSQLPAPEAVTVINGVAPINTLRHITRSNNGNIWMPEWNGGQMIRLSWNGTSYETGSLDYYSAGIPPNAYPMYAAPGPDGNIWFSEQGAQKLARIGESGGPLEGQITEYSGLSGGFTPQGIALGSDGKLWTASWTNGLVARFSYDTGTYEEFPAVVGNLQDVVAGPDGNIWITAPNNSSVVRVLTGTVPTSLTAPTLSATTASPGQTVTASAGTWDYTPTGYRYSWERCEAGGLACQAIGGTTASYIVQETDRSKFLRVRVVAESLNGDSSVATSELVAIPAAPVEPPVQPPVEPPVQPPVQPPATLLPDTFVLGKSVFRGKSSRIPVRFTVSSDQAGVTFTCQIQEGSWRRCGEVFQARLRPGRYTLLARASSEAGTDGTPAQKKFRVLRKR